MPSSAIGFSKLLFRVQNEDRIGVAKEDFAIFILETLRARGFNAVGAENLVFDQDRSTDAEYMLGGTVRELDCLEQRRLLNCRIAIEWQIFDVRAGNVIYTGLTRGVTLGADPRNTAALGKSLVLGALESLLRRSTFRGMLSARKPAAEHAAQHSAALFRRCTASTSAMPEAAEQILPATAFVQAGDGFGSGFFLNSEGFLVTAAHVAAHGPLKVRLRDGTSYAARVIRTAKSVDAALLKIEGASPTGVPCLDLNREPSNVGSEIYAIGAPAREELAFSVTRGIVSGLRQLDGQSFLQTDASISPGNSGGPLVNRDGRVVALVSWKLAGTAVQGIAFGVPIDAALRGLGLEPGDETTPALSQADALPVAASAPPAPFVDGADQVPSIDPDGDRRRADLEELRQKTLREQKLEELRDERTPGYVKIMRWAGLGVGIAGAVGVVATFTKYDEKHTTRGEYDTLNTLNMVSWIGGGLGFASFGASYLLVPKVDEDEVGIRSSTQLGAARGIRLQGTF